MKYLLETYATYDIIAEADAESQNVKTTGRDDSCLLLRSSLRKALSSGRVYDQSRLEGSLLSLFTHLPITLCVPVEEHAKRSRYIAWRVTRTPWLNYKTARIVQRISQPHKHHFVDFHKKDQVQLVTIIGKYEEEQG